MLTTSATASPVPMPASPAPRSLRSTNRSPVTPKFGSTSPSASFKPHTPAALPLAFQAQPPTPASPALPNPTPARPRTAEKKRRPTFVSCTTYPETGPSRGPEPADADATDLPRGQRRSKVQALTKLDRAGTPGTTPAPPLARGPAATSFVPATPASISGPSVQRNPLKRPAPRPGSSPFDLASVRTAAPRHVAPRRDRAFGLAECPAYHPTPAQFADPMAYIESIASEARRYGICKIVPPEGWQMPFTVDAERFRFKTRLQRLNSLEAASRAKLNFLEQLSMYHHQQGDSTVTIPIIDRRLLDVWKLRKEVNSLGGVDEVTRLKAWEDITHKLDFDPARHTSVVRNAYLRIVSPFENFVLRAKKSGAVAAHANGAASGSMPETPARSSRMGGMRSSPRRPAGYTALQSKPVSDLDTPSASRIKVPGFSSLDGSDSELSEEETSPQKPRRPDGHYEKGEVCEVCSRGDAANKILLCDGCDRGFHTYCLSPPLSSVPANEEWFCTQCLLGTGDDYGFDEGEEHSLHSFQARDAAFAHAWFNRFTPVHSAPSAMTRQVGSSCVSETDVEREFWRLVDSPDETVEIEYGADVHSTTHGSAAPTMETHPLDPYAKDGWNLNNMPIVRDSVLRYIKSDISGMTVPWIYVGMLFSAFCWHNEDHYTYSVNYMFWGETKTWYGVPGNDAGKFEAAMKREAPELFEAQPSLLYQLVTMMNPGRLREEGVDVFACDQRPNEFVITFPKAYHCGFNHGINFNEAVNFALPDWLSEGKESVETYKLHAKAPVFSHEELLITITLYSDTIRTALWYVFMCRYNIAHGRLQNSLRAMVEAETARRDKLRAMVPDLKETLIEEDVPEEQYQCCVCKGFCYLAQVTCNCTSGVTCVDHADQLCACPMSSRTLRKRYSESQLEEILLAVTNRASIPEQWRERYFHVLETPRPQLKSLRALLTDGERIQYPLPELEDLRDFVDRANAWCERVASFGVRKSTGRRRKSGKGAAADDDADRSPQALQALLDEGNRLACDAPELTQLRQLVMAIASFRAQAADVFAAAAPTLEQCRTALILGESLTVDLDEVPRLQQLVNRLGWFHRVEEEIDDRAIQYDDIRKLLREATEYAIPDDHPAIVELRMRAQRGREWADAVGALLKSQVVELDKIEELLQVPEDTPVSAETVRTLENIVKTANGWETSARAMLDSRGTLNAATRLCKAVRGATGALGRVTIPSIDKLHAEVDFVGEWQTQLATLLDTPITKLAAGLHTVLKDCEAHLADDDDAPNGTYTCFCRTPATSSMATCNTCNGAYHFKCVGTTAKLASAFQCQLCLRLQYPDRPWLSALSAFTDPHRWEFKLALPEVDTLDAICDLAVKYLVRVVPLIDARNEADVARDAETMTHYLRKIWTLPIAFDAVNVVTGERIVVEDWLYRRLHEALHPRAGGGGGGGSAAGPKKRARRGKFVLPGAREKTFACFCTQLPLDHLLTVECSKCAQSFHQSCAHAPLSATGEEGRNWRCPYCLVKEGKYAHKGVDLRVQWADKCGTNEYIDYRTTLRTLAEAPIAMTLDPSDKALVLECTGFIPPLVPEGYQRPDEGGGEPAAKRRKGAAGLAQRSETPATPATPTPATPASASASAATPVAVKAEPAVETKLAVEIKPATANGAAEHASPAIASPHVHVNGTGTSTSTANGHPGPSLVGGAAAAPTAAMIHTLPARQPAPPAPPAPVVRPPPFVPFSAAVPPAPAVAAAPAAHSITARPTSIAQTPIVAPAPPAASAVHPSLPLASPAPPTHTLVHALPSHLHTSTFSLPTANHGLHTNGQT
ncbi:hypothetical protein Q5752_000091 [Cryptotrichosporon argae]